MKTYLKTKRGTTVVITDLGEGMPLLFVTGWPFSSDLFEYQLNYLLPRGFRTITIDFGGSKESDFLTDRMDYGTFASDVNEVIEYLTLKNIIAIGFSTGAAILARYCNRYGTERLKKMVLISGALPSYTRSKGMMTGVKTSYLKTLIENLQLNRPQTLQDYIKRMFYDKASASYRTWLLSVAMDSHPYATLLYGHLLTYETSQSDLASITIPILLCHGVEDQICSFEGAKIVQNEVKQSFLVPFKRSGHLIMHDEADLLNRTLAQYVLK